MESNERKITFGEDKVWKLTFFLYIITFLNEYLVYIFKVFLWFVGTTPATFTAFQDIYNVRKSIANYSGAVARLDGGPHSAKAVSGKSLRSHSIKLDLLPVPLIKELANLVREGVP